MPRKRKSQSPNQLTGDALLEKVEELSSLNKIAKARECGYVVQSRNGREQVQVKNFMNALLDAQGINLDAQGSSGRGRSRTYRVSVQKNGTIVIGSTYTQEMGLEPGDRFEINLGHHNIKLTAIESEFEDDEFDDDEID